jgi:DNA-binding transcriptional MocR family regulator
MTYFDTVRDIIALPGLTASAKIVLLYLHDRQGQNGHCWPSIGTICRDCNLPRQTVMDSLTRLKSEKYISVMTPEHPAIGRTNHYSINLTSTKTVPVEKGNQYEKHTRTGTESVPVRKSDRSKNRTGTGTKSVPELVRKIDSNVSSTDHKRLTGENIIFSHGETKPQTEEKPVDPVMLARVLKDLGLGEAI